MKLIKVKCGDVWMKEDKMKLIKMRKANDRSTGGLGS